MIALMLSLALAEPEAPEEPATDDLAEASDSQGPVRSSPPAVIPAEPLPLDDPAVHELGDGRIAWHVQIPGVRKVEIAIAVYGGTQDLAEWPTPLAHSAMNWADIATGSHTAEELEILGDVHDISLYSWMSNHAGGISLSVPREDLERGLELAAEVLTDPAFPKKDVKQYVRDELLWHQVNGPNSLSDVSWSALGYGWIPADHPYGARPDLAGYKKLKTKDLIVEQTEWRTSGPAAAVVVGDLSWDEVEPLLTPVMKELGVAEERSEHLEVPTLEKTRVVAVDMPGQAQTALRLRYAAPSLADADRVPFYVTNWAFGGHFLSRLNANLREDKGFTYGAGSSWRPERKSGAVTVYVDVKAENTAAAVGEIEAEIARLVEGGITAEELDMATRNLITGWNGTRETAASARAFYAQLLANEEGVADRLGRLQATRDLDPDATRAVAAKYLGDAPHLWIVVGDRGAIESQLDGLGWHVEWITPEQAILGSF